jgi:hypothetical protein
VDRSLLEASGWGLILFSVWQEAMQAPQPVHLSMSITMPQVIGNSLKCEDMSASL